MKRVRVYKAVKFTRFAYSFVCFVGGFAFAMVLLKFSLAEMPFRRQTETPSYIAATSIRSEKRDDRG